jgi:hypothetical protein
MLLQEMLRVSKSCEETRILISSRAEHDLEALLRPASTEIRVDTRNTDSIQTYVSNRYCNWARNRHFSPEDKREIMTLLSPIADRAKGNSRLPQTRSRHHSLSVTGILTS